MDHGENFDLLVTQAVGDKIAATRDHEFAGSVDAAAAAAVRVIGEAFHAARNRSKDACRPGRAAPLKIGTNRLDMDESAFRPNDP